MRLFGRWELGPVTAAQTPTPPQERGGSGTLNQDGWLSSDEYNPDFRFPESIKVYRRMARSDGSVREAEHHIFAPIKNATWSVEPYGDEPDDLEIAAAVQCAYFKWLRQPFAQHLHQALLHLRYGFQVFEQIFQVVEDEVEYDDPTTGDKVIVPSRQYLTWKQFGHLLPESIWKWNTDGRDLESVTQQLIKNGVPEDPTIPVDQLLYFTNEMEGDDFRGVSVLRSAVKPFTQKDVVEKIAIRAIERHGIGVWVAYPPESASNDSAEYARLEEIFTALGQGDSPYLIAPGPKANAQRPGYDFDLMTTVGQTEGHIKILEYLRGEIKGNVLARFAELGHGSVGARATGDVQSEVWYDALHSVANYVADVHNLQAIPRFVRANFGVERFPKLVVEDIESRSLEEYAKAVALLAQAMPQIVDQSWLSWARRSVDAPDADELPAVDEGEQLIEEEPSPEDLGDEPTPPKE